MLEIPVMIGKDQYYITSDNKNYMLSEHRDRLVDKKHRKFVGEREQGWDHQFFFGTLTGLFSTLFEMKLRASEANDLAAFHDEAAKIKNELIYGIERHKEELSSVTLSIKE